MLVGTGIQKKVLVGTEIPGDGKICWWGLKSQEVGTEIPGTEKGAGRD